MKRFLLIWFIPISIWDIGIIYKYHVLSIFELDYEQIKIHILGVMWCILLSAIFTLLEAINFYRNT